MTILEEMQKAWLEHRGLDGDRAPNIILIPCVRAEEYREAVWERFGPTRQTADYLGMRVITMTGWNQLPITAAYSPKNLK